MTDTPPEPVADPRLGRFPEFDERSRNFQIRTLLNTAEEVIRTPRTKYWTRGQTLDQGREGACVGFAVTHNLAASPIRNKGLSNDTALALYKRAQVLDQWPGEAYSGTSVIAGIKAAQEQGYLDAYRWIGAGSNTVAEDIVDTLGYVGPIVFGIPWSKSMFNPRPSGLMEVDTTQIAGGHAIFACGVRLRSRLYGESIHPDLIMFQNSWGVDWGVGGGRCYIKLEDVVKLMEMGGEGVVITDENLVIRP